MIDTLDAFYDEAEKAVVIFDAFVEKHNLIGRAGADHICYKCGSSQEFEEIRKLFESESFYIHQAIISKRRIAYIKLKQGVQSALGKIKFLELSDQKPDSSQTSRFDHIEIFAVSRAYGEMVLEFEKTEVVVRIERPHHSTHDIETTNGFIIRCTEGSLAEKIAKEEML